MNYEQRISKADLARSAHLVIQEAQRGYTVLVENHGQAEVAIVYIIDFQLQRAAIHYFCSPKEYQKDIKISEATLENLPTDQDRFDLVIGHYLAVHISIGRSAELLGMSPPELQVQLGRSGIPPGTQDIDNEVKIIQRSLRRK